MKVTQYLICPGCLAKIELANPALSSQSGCQACGTDIELVYETGGMHRIRFTMNSAVYDIYKARTKFSDDLEGNNRVLGVQFQGEPVNQRLGYVVGHHWSKVTK